MARKKNLENGDGSSGGENQPLTLAAAQDTFVKSVRETLESGMNQIAQLAGAVEIVNSARQRLVSLGVEVEQIPLEFISFFPQANEQPQRRRGRGAGRQVRQSRQDRTAGGRPRNDSNLVESLQSVLKGKQMSVTDVAEAVQKAGYQTTSPNFRTIVNQALIASGMFKRVGRGIYTAK